MRDVGKLLIFEKHEPNTVIYDIGDPSEQVYLIFQGTVAAVILSQEEKN